MKLTEKEFELLIEALEYFPHKNMGGKFLAKLTAAMLLKDNEEGRAKMEAEFAKREAEEELRHKEEKKKCSIITGKLYVMKGQLVEE